MNDSTLIAIAAAVPSTLGVIASVVIAYFNSRKTAAIEKKAEVIHVLVNSNLTEVKAKLALAYEKINSLEALIVKLADGGKHD